MNKNNDRLLKKSFAVSALINISLCVLSYSFLSNFAPYKKPLEVVLLTDETKSSLFSDAHLIKKVAQTPHKHAYANVKSNQALYKYIEKSPTIQKPTVFNKKQANLNPKSNFSDNADQNSQKEDNNQALDKRSFDQFYESKPKQNASESNNTSNTIPAQDYAFLRKLIEKNLDYPYLARRNGYQGTVVVSFVIDKGAFKDILVAKSSGYAILDKTALEAVKKIEHYVNISKNVKIVLPINFTLNTQ